jgi:WD40 repeat protein
MLYRNPITEANACPKIFFGHSAEVTRMMFTTGDNNLISVGGRDQTVFIWKTDFGRETGDNMIDEEDVENGLGELLSVKEGGNYDDRDLYEEAFKVD